jgi:HEAT repeat protein
LLDPEPALVVPLLAKALKDSSVAVLLATLEAIEQIGPDALVTLPDILRLTSHPDDLVRQACAEALYEIGPAAKAAIPILISLLKDKSPNVRYAAVKALGEQGADAAPAVPILLWFLDRQPADDDFDRTRVIHTLEQIGPAAKSAVPVLIKLLAKNEFRDASIDALCGIGPEAKAAVPALIEITKRENEKVWQAQRKGSIIALGRIGPDAAPAVPTLIAVISNHDFLGRAEAVTAPGQIGPKAKAALPALEAMTHDRNDSDASRRAEAASEAAARIDPAEAIKLGLDADHLLIHQAKTAIIKARPRPEHSEAKKAIIKELVKQLAEVEDPDVGLSPTVSGAAFAPLPNRKHIGTFLITDHGLKHAAVLRKLVELGPDAIPFLLEALGDNSPTKLRIEHYTSFGGMWFGRELDGNPLNPQETQWIREVDFPDDPFARHGTRKLYSVKIGDICFVALGQIVGRRYQAVRYQPTNCVVLNSVTYDKVFRERIRAIWSSQEPAQRLLDSLLRDFSTEGALNGKHLFLGYIAGRLQVEAALRLLFYFPSESVPLIANRLKGLDVAATDDTWKRDAVNRIPTKEFIDAVAWCKEPAIRAALSEIRQRTNDPEMRGILDSALEAGAKKEE